jgi:hypothetical protein
MLLTSFFDFLRHKNIFLTAFLTEKIPKNRLLRAISAFEKFNDN